MRGTEIKVFNEQNGPNKIHCLDGHCNLVETLLKKPHQKLTESDIATCYGCFFFFRIKISIVYTLILFPFIFSRQIFSTIVGFKTEQVL